MATPLTADEFRGFFHGCDQGFCVFEILVNADGQPVDYRFLEINHVFEQHTGLVGAVGKTALELVPNLEPHWVENYGRVALTGEPMRFVQESAAMGRWFDVFAARIGAPERRLVALLFTDITAQRRDQDERRKAEAALRESERRFRSFADTAPAMLWVTGPDGRCTYLSRGWFEYTGQTAEQALGFGWLDAVHPEDREGARRRFVAANERRAAFDLEHRLRRRDGDYRWVIDAGRPVAGAGGAFAGFVGSVIDIHDRKMAEERLDLAVNSGQVGLWYSDLPFDGLVWNNKVKEHFGLPPDAVVTIDTFYERIHPDDREPTRRAIERSIAERVTYDTPYRTIGLDGVTRWIRAIGRAHFDGDRPIRFDGITVDVSELMALREAAEAANRAKDEFLAMLGHELRNPLAPILTALQLLKLRGVDAAERERAIIERQVRHLVGLVDDLLDVSRITRGKVELRKERVELADVVARAVELSSPLLEQQRHELAVDVPRGLIVHGEPGRLAQVVGNLLNNAAKYTEAGGRVTVTAAAEGDRVALTVADTGVGIDAAMLPRVFDLFAQDRQSLARSEGGLGLGLAIVRSLVELHGGTVTARSEGKGRGSAFTITLPGSATVAGVAEAEAPAAAPLAAAAPRARVLVVDDNEDGAVLLATILRTFGYEARTAHDGPEALAVAAAFHPDAALIDLGLPVMDGFELAGRLVAESPRPITLIAVTGYGQERDRLASAEAGFAAHLVKPVDIDALRDVLASLLAARGDLAASPRPSAQAAEP